MPRTRAPRSAEPTVVLKPGRERSLKRRHPWVFSGAIERVLGVPQPGDTVRIQGASGNVVALAAYSPASQIRARVWSFQPDEPVDAAFFRRRLERALSLRDKLEAARHTNALRLVHGDVVEEFSILTGGSGRDMRAPGPPCRQPRAARDSSARGGEIQTTD